MPCTNIDLCEGPPKCLAYHPPDADILANRNRKKEYSMRDRSVVTKSESDEFIWENPVKKNHENSSSAANNCDSGENVSTNNVIEVTSTEDINNPTLASNIEPSDHIFISDSPVGNTDSIDVDNTEQEACCEKMCIDDGSKMIECTTCKSWFHIHCKGISDGEADTLEIKKLPFYCSTFCAPEIDVDLAVDDNDGSGNVSEVESDSDEFIYRIKKRDTIIDQQLDQIEGLKKDLKAQRDLQSKLMTAEQTIEEKDDIISELRAEIEQLKHKNKIETKHREAAVTRIASLETAYNLQVETINSLKENESIHEKSSVDLLKKIGDLEKDLKNAQLELKNHQNINKTILQKEIAGPKDNDLNGCAELKNLNEIVKQLEDDVEKKADELRNTISKNKKELEGLKAHCVAVEDKLAKSEKEATDKQVQIHTLQGQLKCQQALTKQLQESTNTVQQGVPPRPNGSIQHDFHHQQQQLHQADTETDVCEKEFLCQGSCTLNSCPFSHDIDRSKEGVCIIDFERKGECRRQDRCRFSHQTPMSLRNDEAYKNSIKMRKEQTIGICFYDYLEQGSCPRSKQNKRCRFSHNCSQDRRENPFVRDSILRRMQAKNFDIPIAANTPNHTNTGSRRTNSTGYNHSVSGPSVLLNRAAQPSNRSPPFQPPQSAHPPMLSQSIQYPTPSPAIQMSPVFSPMNQAISDSNTISSITKPSHGSYSSSKPSPQQEQSATTEKGEMPCATDVNNVLNNTNFQAAIQNMIMTSLQQFLPLSPYPLKIPSLIHQRNPTAYN